MIQNEQHLLSAFCLLPPELEGNSSWRDPRPNAVHLIGFGKSIRKLDEVPGFMEWKNPSPALLRSVPDGTDLRRAPSPLGRGWPRHRR